MSTLISTILSIFWGSGGPGPVNAGIQGQRSHVGTQARDSYSPGTQAVSIYGSGSRALARGMHHSLYSCNVLYINELREGGPIPPIGRCGLAARAAYPPTYYRIFSNHFLTASTPQIFTNIISKR